VIELVSGLEGGLLRGHDHVGPRGASHIGMCYPMFCTKGSLPPPPRAPTPYQIKGSTGARSAFRPNQ
jgi:hypothetical protein